MDLGCFIVHIKGSHVRISKLRCTSLPVFILAIRAGLYETVCQSIRLVESCTQMVNIDQCNPSSRHGNPWIYTQLDLPLITPVEFVFTSIWMDIPNFVLTSTWMDISHFVLT